MILFSIGVVFGAVLAAIGAAAMEYYYYRKTLDDADDQDYWDTLD
jgi:hypothetical protein